MHLPLDVTMPNPSWSPPDASADQASTLPRLETLSAVVSNDSSHVDALSPAASKYVKREVVGPTSDALRSTAIASPQSHQSSRSSGPASSSHSLNYILNPATNFSSPIEPGTDSRSNKTTHPSLEVEVETEHEVAFLLRHFSEGPGQWLDLFDLAAFFAYYVPVKAITNPLLKNSAAAYTAKQLSRVHGRKSVVGGLASRQAFSELFPGSERTDWAQKGAQYYDKAINMLIQALKDNYGGSGERCISAGRDHHEGGEIALGECAMSLHVRSESASSTGSLERRKRRKVAAGPSLSDEMAAATAILCNYELLDGSGVDWNRHLDGTKSLLEGGKSLFDIAEGSTMPFQTPFPLPRPKISRAKQATFWNFARQDFLSALIHENHTRLDTNDILMWQDAGLLFDSDGFIKASNQTDSGLPEADGMKEDMISNALIWIMSKIVNFIATNGAAPSSANEAWNEYRMRESWHKLQRHLEIWYNGVPDTFKPCAEITPRDYPPQLPDGKAASVFPELWYNIPMCASTMQSYHMARILLLLHQPQVPISGRTPPYKRFDAYKTVTSDVIGHGRAICGIAVSRPEGSVRIHSVQPLYTAGQCLESPAERKEVVKILRDIEHDTGWAAEYRVKTLLSIWGWSNDVP